MIQKSLASIVAAVLVAGAVSSSQAATYYYRYNGMGPKPAPSTTPVDEDDEDEEPQNGIRVRLANGLDFQCESDLTAADAASMVGASADFNGPADEDGPVWRHQIYWEGGEGGGGDNYVSFNPTASNVATTVSDWGQTLCKNGNATINAWGSLMGNRTTVATATVGPLSTNPAPPLPTLRAAVLQVTYSHGLSYQCTINPMVPAGSIAAIQSAVSQFQGVDVWFGGAHPHASNQQDFRIYPDGMAAHPNPGSEPYGTAFSQSHAKGPRTQNLFGITLKVGHAIGDYQHGQVTCGVPYLGYADDPYAQLLANPAQPASNTWGTVSSISVFDADPYDTY